MIADRIAAYVDGFNLYHGIHSSTGRRDLWLDIEKMLNEKAFVDPGRGQELVAVHYFTAAVHGPGQPRQDTYLRALQAQGKYTTTHLGRFQRKSLSCRECGSSWASYEEKESDVSLAVQLVKDAALDVFDRALLISADSDMCPAVRAARAIAPAKGIVAIFPPGRNSDHLRAEVDHTIRLFPNVIRRNQLPDRIRVAGGILARPVYWH